MESKEKYNSKICSIEHCLRRLSQWTGLPLHSIEPLRKVSRIALKDVPGFAGRTSKHSFIIFENHGFRLIMEYDKKKRSFPTTSSVAMVDVGAGQKGNYMCDWPRSFRQYVLVNWILWILNGRKNSDSFQTWMSCTLPFINFSGERRTDGNEG